MEVQINLADIFSAAVKRWWLILICVVTFGVASFGYTKLFVTPMYVSGGTLYVNNALDAENYQMNINDVMMSLEMVDTYSEILSSKVFCQTVSQKLDNGLSAGDIQGMVSIQGVNETELLRVSAVSSHPQISRAVVQEILNNAPAEIERVVKSGKVEVVDNASLPMVPSSPNISRNTFLGMVLGFVLAAAVIFFIEFFDKTIKNEEELARKSGIAVLGVIPSIMRK